MDSESRFQESSLSSLGCNRCRLCHLAMEKPNIPMYAPYNIKALEFGKYYLWCSCGLSKTQPWCDGSHATTNFEPIKFQLDRTQSIYSICGCKYSENPPWCDARHISLPFDPKFPPCMHASKIPPISGILSMTQNDRENTEFSSREVSSNKPYISSCDITERKALEW